MLFVLRKLALLLIESLNASITNQLARLFTAMKYTACLVDHCLQYGMMFFGRHSVRANFLLITGQLIFVLFKTRKVSQEKQ